MPTQVYVACVSDGCPIACVDGKAKAKEVNEAAADEGRATTVEELDRFLRERVHRDDILLYGLGVYSHQVDET
jgi:hypothetical protein